MAQNLSPDFWDEVATLFSEVVELDASDALALVELRCGSRADLRAEVESLLAAHRRADAFMLHPTLAPDVDPALPLREGEIVGQFRLIERIASGGMGTVYRAERADGSFEQRVAVKIIAAPIEQQDIRERFLAERQILASLHHPHIVSLIDGGFTAQGQAYLIMEFVDGVPITIYCRERALGVNARLRLFRQVCDAVQHAHARFVVHSDLKPANVLVTSEGVPKVLDFGIATLLKQPGPSRGEPPPLRASDALTPGYASPEQLQRLPVTIASDVYALGILLFELLAGTRPYNVTAKSTAEIADMVAAAPTVRPSEAVPPPDAKPPYDLRRTLGGDLDAIATRASHRTVDQRYASADALSQDIGRYLSGAPVSARKATLAYAVSKLARRYRIAFASLGLSVALVLAALGVAMWEAHVARVQRGRAVERFNDVRALASAVIFKIHDAVAPLPGSTPARHIIVNEGLKYLEGISKDAGNDADLAVELGRAYIKIGEVQGRPNAANLGDREGAVASFRKAKALLAPVALRPTAQADVFRSYLDAVRFLSETLGIMGSHAAEGIAEAEEAVRAANRFAQTHPTEADAKRFVAVAEFTLAIRLTGDARQPHWEKAAAMYGALLAEAPSDPVLQRNVALVEKYQGGDLERKSDYAAALVHHEHALSLDQQRLDRNPNDRLTQFDVAIDLSNVAFNRWKNHQLADAIAVYTRSLRMRERLSDSDPNDALALDKVAFVHRQLGAIEEERGDITAALDHHRKAIALYTRSGLTTTEARHDTAVSWMAIGSLEAASHRGPLSCEAYRRAYDLFAHLPAGERAFDDGSDPLPEVASNAGRCGYVAAEQWLREERIASTRPNR
jgi:serine/threonine protein kinase